MSWYDRTSATATCRECGWTGTGGECKVGELFEHGAEFHCPRCDHGPGLRQFPTIEEVIADPRAGDADRQAAAELREQRDQFEHTMLRGAEQLPELVDPTTTFTWDVTVIGGPDDAVVIRAGEQEVWREASWYENFRRFGEIAAMLMERYHATDLAPTHASLLYLYGDRIRSLDYVKAVRAALGSGVTPPTWEHFLGCR